LVRSAAAISRYSWTSAPAETFVSSGSRSSAAAIRSARARHLLTLTFLLCLAIGPPHPHCSATSLLKRKRLWVVVKKYKLSMRVRRRL
jgi:hypothetical protein